MSCQKVTVLSKKSLEISVQACLSRANILLQSAPPAPRAREDPLGTWSRLDRFDGWEESGPPLRLQPVGNQTGPHPRRLSGAHPSRRSGFWSNPRPFMSQLMSFMPVVWIVWASIITILLVLLVYRSNLTRYEEDQIFLDDCNSHQKKEQEDILVKVNKIQPAIRIVTGVTCFLTVGIIGVYVWDALQHLM
jgi:hypothetical protein